MSGTERPEGRRVRENAAEQHLELNSSNSLSDPETEGDRLRRVLIERSRHGLWECGKQMAEARWGAFSGEVATTIQTERFGRCEAPWPTWPDGTLKDDGSASAVRRGILWRWASGERTAFEVG